MSLGVFACGGDDSISTADARRIDAGIDGAGIMGLGQLCSDVTDPCPTDAMTCLSFSATAPFGYCTPICSPGYMMTTDGTGAFPPQASRPPLNPGTPACTSAFHATVGRAACGLSVDIMPDIPAGGSPAPNTTYTIDYACAIVCGTGSTCPEGLVCNTTLITGASICIPAE